MVERRKFARRPYQENIDFSVSVLDVHELKRVVLKGTGTDISTAGLGIHGDTMVEPGHVLIFNSSMGRESGIVIWTMKSGDRHRFGVQFI